NALFPDYTSRKYSQHATNVSIDISQYGHIIKGKFNEAAVGAAILNVNTLSKLLVGNILKERYMDSPPYRNDLEVRLKMEQQRRVDSGVHGPDISIDSPYAEVVIGERWLMINPVLHYAAV